MKLRSLWANQDIPKPTSDALEYLAKRINRVFTTPAEGGEGEHNGQTGAHVFPLTLWTPTIGGTGGESGQVYAQQQGFALKAGQLVFVAFRVQLSTLGTITGTVQIKGFPFASTAQAGFRARFPVSWTNMTAAFVFIEGAMNEGVRATDLLGATAAATSLALLTGAQLSNTTVIAGSGVYLTDE